MARLNVGDEAPDFSLRDPTGEWVKRSDFKGRKLLVYFFPKAGTPGCTKQSEAVRDARAELAALGVDAVGISPDPVAAQKTFSDRLKLNFPLLSDPDHAVAEAYGVWQEKSLYGRKYFGIVRSAFLIDAGGTILAAWYRVGPADTIPNALAALKGDCATGTAAPPRDCRREGRGSAGAGYGKKRMKTFDKEEDFL